MPKKIVTVIEAIFRFQLPNTWHLIIIPEIISYYCITLDKPGLRMVNLNYKSTVETEQTEFTGRQHYYFYSGLIFTPYSTKGNTVYAEELACVPSGVFKTHSALKISA